MTASVRPGLVIYGGTFDPVHLGHLRSAIEIRERLGVNELRMVPSSQPPHRDEPGASAKDRSAMLALATAALDGITVDNRELRRTGASYAIDTLREVRAELGDQEPLYFVLGTDAYSLIHTWHEWQSLTDYAHLVVLQRPLEAPKLQNPVLEWVEDKQVDDLERLSTAPHGLVCQVELAQWAVSATEIRRKVSLNQSIAFLVPEAVQAYITEQKLYR